MKIDNKILKKDIVIKKTIKSNRAIPIVNDGKISKWYSHQFLNGGHKNLFLEHLLKFSKNIQVTIPFYGLKIGLSRKIMPHSIKPDLNWLRVRRLNL